MNLQDLISLTESAKAALPAASKPAQRRKAIDDGLKGHARKGGRLAGQPKKDRTVLEAMRAAARQARQDAARAARLAGR